MPPLADTVALVDDDLADVAAPQFPIGQGLEESRSEEALRCHKQESGALALDSLQRGLARLLPLRPGDVLDVPNSGFSDPIGVVLPQFYQRTHIQRPEGRRAGEACGDPREKEGR